MVIARKLLTPTLGFFALLLILVIAYFAVSTARASEAEEQQHMDVLQQGFDEELWSLEKISLALAKQTASNPVVRSAFLSGDRAALLDLDSPAFKSIQGEYRIDEHVFTQSPVTVFLDVNHPEEFGYDLSHSRLALLAANTSQRDISTLEVTTEGLSMHGIAAIQGVDPQGATAKGSVEYSIKIDRDVLTELRDKYGGEWQVMIYRQAMTISGILDIPGLKPTPHTDLLLQSTTLDAPMFVGSQIYQQALKGQKVLSRVQSQGRIYEVLTVPERDFSGQVVAVVDIFHDRTDALGVLRSRIIVAVMAGLAGLLLCWMVLSTIIGRTLQPIKSLTIAADAIAKGNLRFPIPAARPSSHAADEVEQLSSSFYSMGQQLRQLVGGLEKVVAERTRGLEKQTNQMLAASEIAREVTRLSNVEELLHEAVNRVRQRFDYYHSGVFLIDESGEYAVLRSATGEAGRQMVASGHRLRVGQVGLVGAACGTGQPRLAADVEQDPTHFKNPLLPDTRAEAAVPMRIGERIIGALDVQSRQPNAFGESDITALQMIADQLAIAVNNARLIQELNRSLIELEEAHGRLTRENWQKLAHSRPEQAGYRFYSTGAEIQTHAETLEGGRLSVTGNLAPVSIQEIPEEALAAIRAGETVGSQTDGRKDGIDQVSVPVLLRGQAIGAIQLRFDVPIKGAEVVSLVEEISPRLGLLVESARLLQEAQRLAQREQQINLIATQVRSSVNLEVILQNTVRELGKALGAKRAFIELGEYERAGEPETGV